MQAVQMAAGAIAMGAGDVFGAGGVEPVANDGVQPGAKSDVERCAPHRTASLNMGLTAENLADRYVISREAQDACALESRAKALKRAGVMVDRIDVIEMNEAFACQVLACCRDLDPARLNRNRT